MNLCVCVCIGIQKDIKIEIKQRIKNVNVLSPSLKMVMCVILASCR